MVVIIRTYSPALSHWRERDFRIALYAPRFHLDGRQRKQNPKVLAKLNLGRRNRAGVEFIGENGGGPWGRLRKRQHRKG
jgi:hypothetical protein